MISHLNNGTIVFRVDANEQIATGQLMRCISIALQCISQNQDVMFLLAEDKETQRLRDKNIPYRILNTRWDDMESELTVMSHFIQDNEIDWLVVDSYQATSAYLNALDKMVPVLYLDDMAKERYDVSALLHYSQWPDEKFYEEYYDNSRTKVLAGMHYTPLREEFVDGRGMENRDRSIMITTGGTDIYNITGRLLEECRRREEFDPYFFHVIVGNMNRHEAALHKIAGKYPAISLHKNVKNMSVYMRRCELAVSAGGTTLYELCACHIPSVCFSVADNQQKLVEEMGRRQIMLTAGDIREAAGIEKKIADMLLKYIENPELKQMYIGNMENLVDGHGSERIAQFLIEGKLG